MLFTMFPFFGLIEKFTGLFLPSSSLRSSFVSGFSFSGTKLSDYFFGNPSQYFCINVFTCCKVLQT